MLSRVADNLYWFARYLERAENLARLVEVNANLMLDLPRDLSPGWQPLITITGSEALFAERAKDAGEKSVIGFVVADAANPGSMLSSLASARELARTARDMLPREVWEQVNQLHMHVREGASRVLDKRTRHTFLKSVTTGTQALTGMLEGIVSEGPALAFMTLGRNLERADMTSRIVDVRAVGMLPVSGSPLRPFASVQWMSVLRSLSGYQMYRIRTRERVHPAGVVRFLLADEDFPRACVCCLRRAGDVLARLPNSDRLVRRIERVRQAVRQTRFADLDQAGLHGFIDRLQLAIARTNDELARTYFSGELLLDRRAAAARAPAAVD